MVTLILRILVVSGLVSAAALLLEQALRYARVGGRHAWTMAAVASVTLPFVPRLISHAHAPINIPIITIPVFDVAPAAAAHAANYPAIAWLLLSLGVLTLYGIACARLYRARRGWRAASLAGQPVYVSASFGPAVFGFVRPGIVVPEWACERSAEEQRLIVLHEREHIAAADQLQLLLVIAVTTFMPWNPFVWLQARRLRFALEADCDQRVLDAVSDAGTYAQLLVDVGGRQSGLLVAAALAEHRNGLERRIGMIATRIVRNRWKAAALAAVSVVVGVVACESRLPTEPQRPSPMLSMSENVRVAQAERSGPDTPVARVEAAQINDLMVKYYPQQLRSEGLGGVVRVRVRVSATGAVEKIDLVGSSGNKALDEAGLRVAQDATYEPARLANGQATRSELQLLFEFGKKLQPALGQKEPQRKVSADEPSFTPYTDMPVLQNRDEITAMLVREYPPELRKQGIGGSPQIWMLVDRDGSVLNAKVKTPSGVPEIDAAVLRVAKAMTFKPALKNGTPVAVWIVLPFAMKVQ